MGSRSTARTNNLFLRKEGVTRITSNFIRLNLADLEYHDPLVIFELGMQLSRSMLTNHTSCVKLDDEGSATNHALIIKAKVFSLVNQFN